MGLSSGTEALEATIYALSLYFDNTGGHILALHSLAALLKLAGMCRDTLWSPGLGGQGVLSFWPQQD